MIRLPVRFVSAGQFAGAGHWLHPDRTLGTSVIIVVERGCFGACVDQRRYVVKAGQALLLPAGHRHFGVPVEGAEPPVYYWAHFESGSSLYGDALGFDGLHIDLPDPAVNRLIFEFHQLITDLAKQGVAVILMSSDLPELVGMSDRVLVLKNGDVADILEREGLTQEKVLQIAT